MPFPVPNLNSGDIYTEAVHQQRGDGINAAWQMASIDMGGQEGFWQTDATFTRIQGGITIQVNGDQITEGQVRVQARNGSGGGLGQVQMWNSSDSVSMGTANVTATIDGGTVHLINVTFTVGVKNYFIRALRGTIGIEVIASHVLVART